MTSDEHHPASTPDMVPREPSQLEQRLEVVRGVCLVVLVVTLGLAMGGPFNLHLTGTLQRLALIAAFAAFVPFILTAFILIVRDMRRKPAPNRLWAWGSCLLVAGLFLAMPSTLWVFLDVFLLGRHISSIEGLVIVAPLLLTCCLCSIGWVLIFVAFIGDLWRLVHSHWRGPASSSHD